MSFRKILFAVPIVMATFASWNVLRAERPTAPRLFPDKTLAYLRIDDTRELRDKMRETSMGRLSQDPEIRPILSEFYGTIVDALSQVESSIGIRFEEILSIPNGELAIALVPTEKEPALCVLLEAGSEMPTVEVLISQLEKRLMDAGAIQETKELAGIKLVGWGNPDRESQQVGYFIQDGCLVLSSKVQQAEVLAKTWTGNATDFTPLVDNRRFSSIMSRCVGAAGERPQAAFFADPIAIVRELIKVNGNAAMVAAMLPVLGVDGIQGVGGSMIVRPDDFDSITHLHLLLASPRKNLMATIRPKNGSTIPEEWVGEDVGSYSTINWDFKKTLAAVEKIVDNFQGEGAFRENAEKALHRVGLDIQKDVLDQVNDRISLVQVFIRPAKLNSGSNLYALHVKDGKEVSTAILPKLFDKLKELDSRWESDTIAGNVVYSMPIPRQSENIRSPEFCFTVCGNCLLASDSKKALENALYTANGQSEMLADSIEFKMVQDRIKRQLADHETSIVSFSRPEESLRLFYDLAADSNNRSRLKEMSENNPFFKALSNSLERHKLPAFEVISKYLSPSGSFVYEDDSGIHVTGFSLRRE